MEHADDFCDDLEAGGGDLEPGVEGSDELFADVLPWVIHHVIEGAQKDLLLVPRPCLWLWWTRIRGVIGFLRWIRTLGSGGGE